MTQPRMIAAGSDEANADSPRSESIEELFAVLESPLLNYAMRVMRTFEAAEDVVQEAFLRLHAQYAEVREPRRWLYRTVHNLALNYQRQANKTVPLATPVADEMFSAGIELADPRPLPDEQMARGEGIGLVRLSLQTLDERSRELIRLKFTERLSYKEISARTGLTTGHVGYLLHHALKAVANELAATGGVL